MSGLDREELWRILHYDPHAGQQAVHAASCHRFRAVACGVRWGKDWCAAHEMVAEAITPHDFHGWTGWTVGPFHNLADITFGYVSTLFTNHLPHLIVSLKGHDGVLEVRDLGGRISTIRRRSTERGAVTLTGSSVDFCTITEASAVPDTIYEQSISTRLVDRLGKVLAISTPRGTSGWFPDMVRRGLSGSSEDTWAIRSPSWQNDRLDPKEIYRMKVRMRPHAYAQEIEARFVAASGRVFDPEVVRRQATAHPQKPDPAAIYYAGLDLAANRDFNVLTIVRREEDGSATVVWVDRWNRIDAPASVARIVKACRRWTVTEVAADATGLGRPIVDLLLAEDVPVRAVVLTQQRKGELIGNLGTLLEKARLTLLAPDYCPEMVTELEQFAFADEDSKRMSAPENGHDDTVISLALAGSFFRAENCAGRVRHFGPAAVNVAEDEPEGEIEVPEPEETARILHQRRGPVPRSRVRGLGFRF